MIAERQAQEARDAIAGCQQGSCKYPTPGRPAWDPLGAADPPLCMGWHGTVYVERGEQIMRYRRCPRHDAWWKVEQLRIRKRRDEERARSKPPTGKADWDGEDT